MAFPLLFWAGRIILGAARPAYSITRTVVPVIAGGFRIPYRYLKFTVSPRSATQVINAERNIRVTDITPLVRAAIQTRQIPVIVAKVTKNVALKLAPRIALRETRKVVRDVLSPLYTGIHIYQIARIDRIARGRTTFIERNLDKAVFEFGKATRPYKLAPKFSSTIKSYVRVTAFTAAYYEGQKIVKTIQTGYRELKREIQGIDVIRTAPPGPIIPDTIPTIRTAPQAPRIQAPIVPDTRPRLVQPGQVIIPARRPQISQ